MGMTRWWVHGWRETSAGRFRGHGGQASVGWLGACVAAAVLGFALIAAAPGLGGAVSGSLRCAVDSVLGENPDCGNASAQTAQTARPTEMQTQSTMAPGRGPKVRELAADDPPPEPCAASAVPYPISADLSRLPPGNQQTGLPPGITPNPQDPVLEPVYLVDRSGQSAEAEDREVCRYTFTNPPDALRAPMSARVFAVYAKQVQWSLSHWGRASFAPGARLVVRFNGSDGTFFHYQREVVFDTVERRGVPVWAIELDPATNEGGTSPDPEGFAHEWMHGENHQTGLGHSTLTDLALNEGLADVGAWSVDPDDPYDRDGLYPYNRIKDPISNLPQRLGDELCHGEDPAHDNQWIMSAIYARMVENLGRNQLRLQGKDPLAPGPVTPAGIPPAVNAPGQWLASQIRNRAVNLVMRSPKGFVDVRRAFVQATDELRLISNSPFYSPFMVGLSFAQQGVGLEGEGRICTSTDPAP